MQPLERVAPKVEPLVDAHVYKEDGLIEDVLDASSFSSLDVSDDDMVTIENVLKKEKIDPLVVDLMANY
ncbi:hypothetical protein GOP47_0018423 [Adiantum capillus-veneris]|uniref:Uncharacterized protein n=1 Tax=Adiantum capillus-veneris TaxID=13818 RepID=A0A9D4Z8R4_ADICA|nr:hypothetical protein GOP47_0018423 [Adiantum capillus-veneris]